jgi:hypothetical protein
MIVMMIAITPSLNAFNRSVLTPQFTAAERRLTLATGCLNGFIDVLLAADALINGLLRTHDAQSESR